MSSVIGSVGAKARTYLTPQSLLLTGSSQSLTVPPAPLGQSVLADIYCEGASSTDYARYWHGGQAPTAAVGKKLKDHEEIPSADPASFRALNGSGTCTLRVDYYYYA